MYDPKTHIVVQVIGLTSAHIFEKYSYILKFLQPVCSYGLLENKDTNYCLQNSVQNTPQKHEKIPRIFFNHQNNS